jgi:predicted RecA/RadA family phage recombinase
VGVQTTNLCTPYYEPGARPTGRAFGSAVVGKRFVAIAAKKDPGSAGLDAGATGGNILIAPAGANDAKTFGVAEHDAAIGKTTAVLRGGFIVPVTAGAAITAGQKLAVGALGKAIPVATTETMVGLALTDAALDADCVVALV